MTILAASDIARDLSPRVPASFDDPRYVLAAGDWLTGTFLRWFGRHLRETRTVYIKHLFDCEDFARRFKDRLIEAARPLPIAAGIAVATLKVRNITTSLGMPAGSHALNLVGIVTPTGREWLVIEPQNQLHVPLPLYETADRLRAHF